MLEDLRDYGLLWQRKVNFEIGSVSCMLKTALGFISQIQPHTSRYHVDIVPTSFTHNNGSGFGVSESRLHCFRNKLQSICIYW